MEKNKWFLITIDDPKFISVASILDVFTNISKIIDLKFVVLERIQGAANSGLIVTLQHKENILMNLDEALMLVQNVESLEWGDFFLFKTVPINWSNPINELYPFIIKQTDLTLRIVDNQYFYIYTTNNCIVTHFEDNYNLESVTLDFLDNLDFPE